MTRRTVRRLREPSRVRAQGTQVTNPKNGEERIGAFRGRGQASTVRRGTKGEVMKLRGMLIASAALTLLAGSAGSAAADSHEGGEVKCQGINGCSGKGECAAADGSHGCSGKNSCKGKGWVHAPSAEQCTEQGGEVLGG